MKKIFNGFKEIICEHYFRMLETDGDNHLYYCEVYFNHLKNNIYVRIYRFISANLFCYWDSRKIYYTKNNEYIHYKGNKILLGWL